MSAYKIHVHGDGYLTATEKKHINAILNSEMYASGQNNFKVNTKEYALKDEGNGYIMIRVATKDSSIIMDKNKFRINNVNITIS